MKLILKPLAAAVTLALASVSAHAALTAPTQTLTSSPSTGGLYLAVFDSNGNNSELVNLTYAQSAITAASGALTPNAATSPFVSTTAPTGTGNVLQLDFGKISGFGSLFTSANAATTEYMVLDATTTTFQVTGANPLNLLSPGVTNFVNVITGEVANWNNQAPTVGDLKDATGAQTYSVKTALQGGTIGGQVLDNTVGSALNFYNGLAGRGSLAITPYANSTGNGYWFLSSAGDLTWNVPVAGTTPVPLPAAVWLLGSGLLGMAGIARRRRVSV